VKGQGEEKGGHKESRADGGWPGKSRKGRSLPDRKICAEKGVGGEKEWLKEAGNIKNAKVAELGETAHP